MLLWVAPLTSALSREERGKCQRKDTGSSFKDVADDIRDVRLYFGNK